MRTQEKLSALVAILKGKPELARQILADAEGVQKAAEAAGLEFKDVSEMISAEPVTEPLPEEVIPAPAVEEAAPVEPPAEIEQKAAPAAEPAEIEPVEIGDWSPEQLTSFVSSIVKQMTGKKESEAAEFKAASEHTMQAVKGLQDQVSSLGDTLKNVQLSLSDLTDARPVGIKQMQQLRPTERMDNVVTVAPTGPVIDPGFQKFVLGGK